MSTSTEKAEMQCGIYKIAIKDDDTLIPNVLICLIENNYMICIHNPSAPKIFHFPRVVVDGVNHKTITDCDELEKLFDQVNYKGAYANLIDEIAGTGAAFLMYLSMLPRDEADPSCFPREVNAAHIRNSMLLRNSLIRDSVRQLEEDRARATTELSRAITERSRATTIPEERPTKRQRQKL